MLRLFDTAGFPARWSCGTWSDLLGWTHILADLLIFSAYMAIPVLLARLWRRRRGEVPFPRLLLVFAGFVFACGTTHFIEAVIFWHPVYRLAGLLKVVTAIVSWATVLALYPSLPVMMTMRMPEALEREVEMRTAELEQTRTDLLATNRRLENTNRMLEEIVYAVSHDLKAPLVTASGFLEVLEEDMAPDERSRLADPLRRVRGATERMHELLGHLVHVAHVPDVGPTLEVVELRPVVERLLADLPLDDREVSVADGTLRADPVWLDRVVDNLLRNAVVHGGPHIRIATRGRALVVEDDGPGIAPALRERVFRLYERLDPTRPGSGVGLALVARIAERHGGRAWVEERPGGGARFVVELASDA
jgi:hypothetical protein